MRARVGAAIACSLLIAGAGCGGEVDGSGSLDAAFDVGAGGQAGQMQLPSIAGSGGAGHTGSGGAGRAGSGGAAHAGTGGTSITPRPDAGMTPRDAGSDAGTGEPPSGEPRVRFIGRTDTRQAGVVRFEWSGSGLAFRFSGTEASIALDDRGGFFTRLVDGQQVETLETQAGERSYELATGLADATHTIELYRRTEASFGETRFIELDLGSDGVLLAPAAAPERRIELIGDSITCGYGDEGMLGCPFEAATENHYLTYGAIAARALDAELDTIAWSGKGMVYNYGDDKNEPLPALYDRALGTDAQSDWDFSHPEPDVVVINLGTNDFSTDDDPSEATFSDAYDAFLVRLRGYYPNAWIMCLVPTMLGGTDLETADAYIAGVVSHRNAQGDARVVSRALAFTQDGAGCDYHPSLATHASMAQALIGELESLLGW